MTRATIRDGRGVYKFLAGGVIYYRLGNNLDDAKEGLRRELEHKLGSSVLVPEITVLSKEK